MERIATPTAVGGRFTAGDGAAGQSATQFSDTWCNAVQEEIMAPIEAVGITPGPATNQLLTAIRALIRGASGARNQIVSGRTGLSGDAMPHYLGFDPSDRRTAILHATEDVPFEALVDGKSVRVTRNLTLELTAPTESQSSRSVSAQTQRIGGNLPSSQSYDLKRLGEKDYASGRLGPNNTRVVDSGTLRLSTSNQYIGARTGRRIAFRFVADGVTEIFSAHVASSTELRDLLRAWYFITQSNPSASADMKIYERGEEPTLEALKTVYIYLDNSGEDARLLASEFSPIISHRAPPSPMNGQYWRRSDSDDLFEYDGTAWRKVARIPIGDFCLDSNGIQAYRCRDFSNQFSNLYKIDLGASGRRVFAKGPAIASIYGTVHDLSGVEWDSMRDAAPSVSLGSLDTGFFYLDHEGAPHVDTLPPHYRPDLRGYYHRHKAWRCLATARMGSDMSFREWWARDRSSKYIPGKRRSDAFWINAYMKPAGSGAEILYDDIGDLAGGIVTQIRGNLDGPAYGFLVTLDQGGMDIFGDGANDTGFDVYPVAHFDALQVQNFFLEVARFAGRGSNGPGYNLGIRKYSSSTQSRDWVPGVESIPTALRNGKVTMRFQAKPPVVSQIRLDNALKG